MNKVIYELKRNRLTQKRKEATLVPYMTFSTMPIFLLQGKIKGIQSYVKFITKYNEVGEFHR